VLETYAGRGSNGSARLERVNLVVMGDFTGRASRDVIELMPQRKLLNVDVDNFARLFVADNT
jgi:predicted component of type VI protein secretion system